MWGLIADKYGRRPALLYGLMGTAISATLFGFAPTFFVAVIARFLWGFLNGNLGVSKTYVAEILDDSNTPRGMALFGVIGGIGRTIGPAIGKSSKTDCTFISYCSS
jgi:MFS family permease